MLTRHTPSALFALLAVLFPLPGWSAELDGAGLSLAWALPFAGVLLSIAVLPLLAPAMWHHHFGKIAGAWALAFLLPFAALHGAHAALAISVHALVAEYLPFIILLTALFTVAGGICVRGNLHGTPALNTGLLALGTLLASVMGTTGAAMLLIRPLIRANDDRKHTVHVVVFFIFLVANAGGSLTPLGDPPLFLGFLKGVDFFWTARHLLGPMAFLCGALLLIFYLLDRHFYLNREERRPLDPTPDSALRLEGKFNFLLLGAVVGLVLMSGLWKPGVATEVLGTPLEWQNLLRDGALLGVILLSLWLTPTSARAGNDFGWGPMLEVGKLFAAIFLTLSLIHI